MTDPAPPIIERRRWHPSAVWLVPVVAALVGLSLLAKVFLDQGPTITVGFSTAEGLEPGKTKVKFKNVEIGLLKSVSLAQDRSRITAIVSLTREAKDFAVSDSRFWVVRPRFAAANVSGLNTLLSGAYIGVDPGHSGNSQTEFLGLDQPPVVASTEPGHRFQLEAQDIGSLDVGSPVFFRRIEVGRVEGFTLAPDGHGINLGIFIKSPYDRFVSNDSRFWHASGVDLQMDAAGVHLQTQSLATVLMGGIAFETPGGSEAVTPAGDGAKFNLAANHADAVKPQDSSPPITVVLHFKQSVRGLSVGAPVDFRGVEIGQVRSIAVSYDAASQDFAVPVVVDLYPDRLTPNLVRRSDDEDVRMTRLAEQVRRGLRAQLRTGSLLTGQLYVALDFFPEAPRVSLNIQDDTPDFPTMPGELQELQRQVQALLTKLNALPLAELAQDTHRTLTALEAGLKHMDQLEQQTNNQLLPEIRADLETMRKTMDSLSPDAPLQQDSRAALQSMTAVARSLKSLTDTLDRQPESLLRGKSGDKP